MSFLSAYPDNALHTITLGEAVRIANDSSLTAFRHQNLYASGYWEWRTYKANRLPSVYLSLKPVNYNRYITQRYNSMENIDVFRAQQSYSASAGIAVTQNVDFLGGALYVESDLQYLRNFGDYSDNQFSSIPFRIGYRQSLMGFNQFRWEKKIEPMKYEKVKKEFIYNMESVSEEVVTYYFDLALAQSDYLLAKESLASCDTLYTIGERRFKIAAISDADLLVLHLDKLNAENALENAQTAVKRARSVLASYIGLATEQELAVTLPEAPSAFDIPLEKALRYARANSPSILSLRQSVVEARREMSRCVAESRFDASIDASVGFNQVADKFGEAYSHLMRQDLISVSVSIPLADWGVRKGKVNIAKNNLIEEEAAVRQKELDIDRDVTMTVQDFHTQQRLVASAVEALKIANLAYERTSQRFVIGKADISALTLARNRQREANTNYINAVRNYWFSYYKIRRLTLYDFEKDVEILADFDRALGVI
ncbi:MAG: TolC family protein [Muribaculum sp.]|nr:TolC family protein [Muribaculum sp.]